MSTDNCEVLCKISNALHFISTSNISYLFCCIIGAEPGASFVSGQVTLQSPVTQTLAYERDSGFNHERDWYRRGDIMCFICFNAIIIARYIVKGEQETIF